MTKRTRGTGSVFIRPGSRNYWIQYCQDGRVIRESAETHVKQAAESKLRKRLEAIEKGQFRGLAMEKMTVSEIVNRLLSKKDNGELAHAKSLDWDKTRWEKHLEPFFGDMKARNVTEDKLSDYINSRKAEQPSAAPATINRELALLRRAFKIHTNLPSPKFPRLEENNVRKGFLSDEDFTKLAA